MEEKTRPARPSDVPELERLVAEGRDAVVDARGGSLWLAREAPQGPVADTYAAAIATSESSVQIGCIDEVPLGFLLATIDDRHGRRLAVVRELYVTPLARGVGLGELMMDATVAWAGEHGCEGLDGYALPGDRATKNFFETFGLVARGIVVHRSLRP